MVKKHIVVCTDPSEYKPDGIFFSVMLPSGIVAFDVCYNGDIKNVNESVVFTEQIFSYLAKMSKSMRVYLENGGFNFDGDEHYEKMGSALYCNSPYIRGLIEFLWNQSVSVKEELK